MCEEKRTLLEENSKYSVEMFHVKKIEFKKFKMKLLNFFLLILYLVIYSFICLGAVYFEPERDYFEGFAPRTLPLNIKKITFNRLSLKKNMKLLFYFP